MRCVSVTMGLASAALLLASGLHAGSGVELDTTAHPDRAVADPSTLVAKARRVQQADLASWSDLTFERLVLRERLDADDRVVATTRLEFVVTPKGGGRFNETLRRVDGRLASRSEVREHRRAGRFEKRYRTAFVGEATEYEQGDFSLAHFMTRPTYTYGGIEWIDGLRCHRLDFPAEPASAAGGGVASRLSAGTEGTLWIQVHGLHAVRATSTLVRPVSAMMGLVKIERVEIEVTTLVVGAHRLPREIRVTTSSVLGGRRQHKRNRFLYSAHRLDTATVGAP